MLWQGVKVSTDRVGRGSTDNLQLSTDNTFLAEGTAGTKTREQVPAGVRTEHRQGPRGWVRRARGSCARRAQSCGPLGKYKGSHYILCMV